MFVRGADKRGAGGESGAVGEGQIGAYVGRQREAGLVERVGRMKRGQQKRDWRRGADRSWADEAWTTEAGLMKCGQKKLDVWRGADRCEADDAWPTITACALDFTVRVL